MIFQRAEGIQGSGRHPPEPCRDVPTTRTQLGTRRSQKRTVLSWEPDAIIHPPQVNRVRTWPAQTQRVSGEPPVSSGKQGLGRTSVAAQRVQPLPSLAVGGVDVAVPSARADQDGPAALGALHEGQVPDGAVMHAELQVRPFRQKTQIKRVLEPER